MAGNALLSPRFLRAKNEAELQLLMLKLQMSEAKQFKWIAIYPTKNGVIGWYYDDKVIR